MREALLYSQLNIADHLYAERLTTKAINEAMLNVKQHAYPKNNNDRFWWCTAAIFKDELHIALCDRGVGIPKNLEDKGWFKILKDLNPASSDAQKIGEAMKYTRSSRKKGRGTGLGSQDIQNLILEAEKGHLTIISGKGYFRLQGENLNETEEKLGYMDSRSTDCGNDVNRNDG